jgi:murein DD-endopeptidase MepM/ murein hydrolase activator NlpD
MPRRTLSSIWNHRFLPGNLPQKHIIIVLGLSFMLAALLNSGSDDQSPPSERRVVSLNINNGQASLPPAARNPSQPRTVIPPPQTAAQPTTTTLPQQPRERADTLSSPTLIATSEPTPADPVPPPTSGAPTPLRETEASTTALSGAALQTVTVRTGDSLSKLFQRVGLNDRDLYQVLQRNEEAKDLRRLYPGEELTFQIDGGILQSLRYIKSPLETLFIERSNGSFQTSKALRAPEVRQRFSHAVIQDNLFQAGDRARMSHGIIMELANVFSGVIDFVYDPRRGDAFSVLYEELYLDGKKYDDGKIIAAYFTNQGIEYPAFHYTNSQGNTGYYNANGVSMRKAFLRAPVDFTRISSHFDPSRLHPIFKTKRPHRGIDYAAKRGTPVFATGDGRVTQAGYSRANGNYLVVAHGNQFITKYLHLHKKQVKQGQRVRQGQIIGQVGSTGYATGPHLHYEFLLDGVHRNPRTIHKKLPKARAISKSEMPRFQASTAPLQAQINNYHHSQLMASGSASTDNRQ